MGSPGTSEASLNGDGVSLDLERKRRLVAAVAQSVIERTEELTALDAAIGDGDHGANMKRGFEAVLQDLEALAAMSLTDLLKGVGTRLVMKVGGASGPLYGTFFLALAKELPEAPSRPVAISALGAAIAAVKARGKSDVGQKTMLDVLTPAFEAFASGGGPATVKEAAEAAAKRTIPMRATRGRASFLGERSIGHMDPGARSSSLMIGAICDEFGA
ncbi:MAG: dihydroxyacetone kinase subunit L [Caulobacteraceae bacterium]|nr:dihydroxyacetone kinase subunit L [Caulobacteraceae bacterium]